MSDSEQAAVNSRPPVKRRYCGRLWLFRGMTVLLVIGVVELASLAIWLTFPPVSRADLATIQENVAALGTERKNDLEVLHPYVGWAFNPDATQLPGDVAGVNALGFVDSGPSVRRRSPDRFVIGVFGGSVAQQMTTIGEQAFRDRLAASPLLRGRSVEIVRLAMSGYKQPQQLMALNYVLALGGEFDVVVNIDGFNETGLVVGENDGQQVFAAYPPQLAGAAARCRRSPDLRDFVPPAADPRDTAGATPMDHPIIAASQWHGQSRLGGTG